MTEVGATEWRINDELIHLRRWASNVVYKLPAKDGTHATLGADAGADIVLEDPGGLVSRKHASITREDGRYVLRDLGSKNGTRIDGARRSLSVLEPGVEIVLGGTTLVAESRLFVELRSFLQRLLGWNEHALEAVDLALRSVRTAAARRGRLVLCGEGDLALVAAQLHRITFGSERPFVMSTASRRDREEQSLRFAAKNFESGLAALEAAHGGTVCIWGKGKARPRNYLEMVAALRDPASRVQLVVCVHETTDGKEFDDSPVVIPRLSKRAPELAHVVDEYIRDAATALGVATDLDASDRAWIRKFSARSLSEIEQATLRLVALRHGGGWSAAALLLGGISHAGVARWFKRRDRSWDQ
ncbi:MAG TPA: FHA domain-containing protein [Kofleriaceae bacterium]|jgi:hypothetical protein